MKIFHKLKVNMKLDQRTTNYALAYLTLLHKDGTGFVQKKDNNKDSNQL